VSNGINSVRSLCPLVQKGKIIILTQLGGYLVASGGQALFVVLGEQGADVCDLLSITELRLGVECQRNHYRNPSIMVPLLPTTLTLQEVGKEILRCYLEVFFIQKEVARVLNISLRTLHVKVRAYGLPTRPCRMSNSPSAKIAV
jgi:hypothetical protein